MIVNFNGYIGIGSTPIANTRLTVINNDTITNYAAYFQNLKPSGHGVKIMAGTEGSVNYARAVETVSGHELLTVTSDYRVGIGASGAADYTLSLGNDIIPRLHFSALTNPSSPNTGSCVIYYDGTNLKVKNSAGAVATLTAW
jgi:hypothetical protein